MEDAMKINAAVILAFVLGLVVGLVAGTTIAKSRPAVTTASTSR